MRGRHARSSTSPKEEARALRKSIEAQNRAQAEATKQRIEKLEAQADAAALRAVEQQAATALREGERKKRLSPQGHLKEEEARQSLKREQEVVRRQRELQKAMALADFEEQNHYKTIERAAVVAPKSPREKAVEAEMRRQEKLAAQRIRHVEQKERLEFVLDHYARVRSSRTRDVHRSHAPAASETCILQIIHAFRVCLLPVCQDFAAVSAEEAEEEAARLAALSESEWREKAAREQAALEQIQRRAEEEQQRREEFDRSFVGRVWNAWLCVGRFKQQVHRLLSECVEAIDETTAAVIAFLITYIITPALLLLLAWTLCTP